MASRSHNLAFDSREETAVEVQESLPSKSVGKDSLPRGKENFLALEEIARECLSGCVARGKEWAAILDVSEGQIARWATSDSIPQSRCFQILRKWKDLKKRIQSTDEKIETWIANHLLPGDPGRGR